MYLLYDKCEAVKIVDNLVLQWWALHYINTDLSSWSVLNFLCRGDDVKQRKNDANCSLCWTFYDQKFIVDWTVSLLSPGAWTCSGELQWLPPWQRSSKTNITLLLSCTAREGVLKEGSLSVLVVGGLLAGVDCDWESDDGLHAVTGSC